MGRSHTRTPLPLFVRLPLFVWLPLLYSAALACLILGPLLGPGHLLLRDAVSTPRSYLTDTALGLGEAAARAVPQDALVAALSSVVDGGIVVTAILLLSLTLAGAGAAAMVGSVLPGSGLAARLLAVTVTLWNPYVAERLLQGHWSLLAGYAALPWTVAAAVAVRRGDARGWALLAVCLAAAGLTPTGVVLVAILAVVTLADSPRRLVAVAGLFALAASPWLVATSVGGGDGGSDPAGVAAFAARAEPGLGTLGSVAGLGGIWNADAVPPGRTSGFAVVGTVVLLAIVAAGLPALWRRRRHPVVVGVVALAAATIALVALAATPPGIALGELLVESVPGAGLARDTQKWVALTVPAYALAAAAALRGGVLARHRAPAATSAALALLVALPGLAWGVSGALRPVTYSPEWRTVVAHVDDGPGDVAVLPAGMFRVWDGRPSLDPAPRMLPADVPQTGELVVSGGTVAGEGGRAGEIEDALLAGAPAGVLADLGVRWVLVEHGTPGPTRTPDELREAGYEDVFRGSELTLVRVPGDVTDTAASSRDRAIVLAAHGVWLVTGLAGAAVLGASVLRGTVLPRAGLHGAVRHRGVRPRQRR
ncbi:hypothetical protein [Rhodococcus rhodnii]|uniref:Transmembrane protein n=1 Tax=Rhodococcus rhodnii LMG 5362 TaxID=1273125 RepID=R7WM27_9NOCA|nr:hypothetical protein Rrhod_2344 [Rhodococcus rhodnii LMG 5362]